MEHVFTESMFLVGFVIFIAAILVLDMLVIDRKAHVVSIKEAGSWTAVWIILALAFAVFIYFHGDMVHGIENFDDLKLIASRYASHLKLDPNDYEASLQQYRHYMTISYISVTAFIISCVNTRVSRCHDSTSLRAISLLISPPISLSIFCRSRSPGMMLSVGSRNMKSRLRSASRIRRTRVERRRWWSHSKTKSTTRSAARRIVIYGAMLWYDVEVVWC